MILNQALPSTNAFDAAFSPLEIAQILGVKSSIKEGILDFRLTLKKLGGNMEQCYFVSGGCIGSFLRGEEVNDYDVYFFDGTRARIVVSLYMNDDSYKNEVAEVNEKYRDIIPNVDGKLITENAITLKNKTQLITKLYGEPAEVRKTFDFVHCMPYYDSRDDKLYISREQYNLNLAKKMKVNNNDALSSHRQAKFIERGWTWL